MHQLIFYEDIEYRIRNINWNYKSAFNPTLTQYEEKLKNGSRI